MHLHLSDIDGYLVLLDYFTNGGGILLGIVTLYYLSSMIRLLGALDPSVINGLRLYFLGLIAFIVAMVLSIMYNHSSALVGSIHDFLMFVGMVFVAWSMYKIATRTPPAPPAPVSAPEAK